MKRADIIKFNEDNKFIIYPINTLEGGGGIASSPYFILKNPTNFQIAEKLLDALEKSIVGAPRPLDWNFFRKEHLKSLGVKTMKSLHKNSLNVGVFVKDENYFISPTVNKGSRQGYHGELDDRIIIPTSSSIEELANNIQIAFDKSS